MPGDSLKVALLGAAVAFTGGLAAGLAVSAALTVAAISAASTIILSALAPKPEVPDRQPPTVTVRAAVQPARWILGRARVSGALVWAGADGAKFYQIVVVAEGRLAAIEKLWALGEEVPFTRHAHADGEGDELRAGGRFRDRLRVREYFNPGASRGAEARSVAAGADGGMRWGESHRLDGKSYVLIEAQGTLEDRFWKASPQITMLVKGQMFTWPGQTTPAWTENAAAIQYWWLTVRRGENPDRVDLPAFHAAYALCDENVGDSIRYSINGLLYGDETPAAVQDEFNFAMSGEMLEWDGRFVMRPGVERAASVEITEDDVIAEPLITPAPPQNNRINAIQCQLVQSRRHDYSAVEVGPVEDVDAEAQDGEYLPLDLGSLRFCDDPVTTTRLLRTELKRNRGSLKVELIIMPGEQFEMLMLVPGDKVLLTLPEYGFARQPMRVLINDVQEDWSVQIVMQEWPDGLYDDATPFAESVVRQTIIPADIPPPENVRLTKRTKVLADGTTVASLLAEWDAAGYRTRIVAEEVGGDTAVSAETTAARYEFAAGLDVGAWRVSLVNISQSGRTSAPVQEVVSFGLDDIPAPPAPEINAISQNGGDVLFVLLASNSRDVAGIEVRYTSGNVGDTGALAEIATEDEWLAAPIFGESTILPGREAQPVIARLRIPISARYRLFARYVSRAGKLSDIVDAGSSTYIIPAANEHVIQAWPQWLGTMHGMTPWPHSPDLLLVPEGNLARETTKMEWRGAGDYPLGDNDTGSASVIEAGTYITREIDLNIVKALEVLVEYELFVPENSAWASDDVSGQTHLLVRYRNTPTEFYNEVQVEPGALTQISARYVSVEVTQFRSAYSLRALRRLGVTVREV